MSTRVGYLKRKNGHITYPNIPIIGKYISCACICINYNTWSNSGIARNRGFGPSYSICKHKIVKIRDGLQYYIKRRASYGVCTSKVQKLLTGKTF
jgi:hypothetical protein